MSSYNFSHGTKFMIHENEYIVRKEKEQEIEVENLSYKKIETWNRGELLKLWDKEELIFKVIEGNEFEIDIPDYGLIPKSQREEAKKRLKILEPVIKGEVLPGEIKIYVESLPENQKISLATLYNWKKKYEESNDIRSLISRNDRKGPRNRWSNEIAKNKVKEVLNEFLYEGENHTIDSLYNEYLLRIDELNEFREIDFIKPVSNTTFWRIKQDIYELEKKEVHQYGRVLANLNKNGSISKVVVNRPLERVEIDWTPVDILLIDPKTLKPKKPYLVYAIDKYTDHPLGFFVTFDEVNAKAIKQCLLHCLMPKIYISELYPLVENEWKAYGKPELLVFDNSKVNDSLDVQEACMQLGIETTFCPVDSGYLKGSVERAFKTLNTKVFHSLKGTTFSNTFERGRYDSEGKAYLTMQSFIYICHIAMVDLVANDINKSKRATRHELWIRGLQENPEISLDLVRTKKELKMILMSGIKYRKITNKGVAIKNEQYTSPELMKLRHKMRSTGKEKNKVRVRFDLSDMRCIYIYNEYDKKYIEAYNKDLEGKGFDVKLPVPYLDLEWDSKQVSQSQEKRDRRLFARANRNIRLIQDSDRKKFYKIKRKQDSFEETNVEYPSYQGISTEGISHIQLGTPEAVDTIQIIKDDQESYSNKKTKKRSKTLKKKSVDKNLIETSDTIYVSCSFDVDIDELPDWDTKNRRV